MVLEKLNISNISKRLKKEVFLYIPNKNHYFQSVIQKMWIWMLLKAYN